MSYGIHASANIPYIYRAPMVIPGPVQTVPSHMSAMDINTSSLPFSKFYRRPWKAFYKRKEGT